MGKFIDDLNHLSADVQHIHMDIEHLSKDLNTLAEKNGIDNVEMPGLQDLRDHLKDLDGHTHDVLNHIGHIQTESSS